MITKLKLKNKKIISLFLLLTIMCITLIIGYLMIIDIDCLLFGKEVVGKIEPINENSTDKQLVFYDNGNRKTKILKNSVLKGSINVIISKRFNKFTYLSKNNIIYINLFRFVAFVFFFIISIKLIRLHFQGKDINSLFPR